MKLYQLQKLFSPFRPSMQDCVDLDIIHEEYYFNTYDTF
jgi:hypothetical protein